MFALLERNPQITAVVRLRHFENYLPTPQISIPEQPITK